MTDFRQSQNVLEVWIADPPAVRVSQTRAEVWIQNQPPTFFGVSQAALEAWETMTAPQVKFVVSQLRLEIWGYTPTTRVFWLSSQTI